MLKAGADRRLLVLTIDNGIGEAVCNFGLCRVACPAGYVSRSASTGGFYW